MDVESTLKKLVSINSVFQNEKNIGIYLESHLQKLGFSTKRQYLTKNRFNILAERLGKGSTILFYGHMDTVTSHGDWKGEPFKIFQQGDKLYGLGSCDMKGGIAAMLTAVDQVRDRKIKVLLCVDEENISEGVWTAVKNKKWFNDVKFMVSCEPGDSKRHTGGANVVTIGRRGRVVIEVDVFGLSSHGANPQRGINAIDEAAKIATAMHKFKLANHSKLGKETIFTRKITGSSESALDLPDKAHIEFDVQLVPPSRASDAISRVEDVIKYLRAEGRLHELTTTVVGLKKRGTPYIEPYINDGRSKPIRKVLRLIKSNFRDPIINYGSSVADDNVLCNELRRPIVTIGPTGGNEHAPNEWVSRKSLVELVETYKMIIKEI